jgi:nucleoside-diphosphate-sugar epimerase
LASAAGLVAVTGATGFLGRRLVPALVARGWRVRVLARRSAPAIWGETSPDMVLGDLGDPAALRALAADAAVIIHGAGLIKARNRAAFHAVNRDGAARVAEAAGGARVIQVSSLAAREPSLSDYAASKRAGEEAARAILGKRLTVIRPPAIYGPGDRETLGLFRLARAGAILPTPASKTARLALAHVDDVAAALADQLDGPWTPGTFAIGGARPEGYGWREIFTTAAAAMGRDPTLIAIPGWLIQTAAVLAEGVGRVRRAPAIFNRGKARELLHGDWSVSEAEAIPGCPAPFRDLRTGFDQTVAWYRAEGWLT